ncbi:hypothetical protein SAMN06297387_12561 [Streptomyces zhaozhouensis]|uniref:Uncharacterized protein n=1 Tax=Streptomyces zhaozhouensis TaxID=1300267 RepID=A0A286E669_9ACTN|nr:hypothetical protein [Streptomyces zhaozhouensis]SOD66386.1 hypothetical protein SAMN06297387_12561 [Streptomyces zhaozhouensis]
MKLQTGAIMGKIFTVALWLYASAFALLFIAAIVAIALDAAGVIDLPEIDAPEGESSDHSTPYDDPFWPPYDDPLWPPVPTPPLPQPPLR